MNKVFASFAIAVSLLPPVVQAYDYTIIGVGYEQILDVEIYTASFFCANRHPVENGMSSIGVNPGQGSTAPGCLIRKVAITTPQGEYEWNGLTPGGTFQLFYDTGGTTYIQCTVGGGSC